MNSHIASPVLIVRFFLVNMARYQISYCQIFSGLCTCSKCCFKVRFLGVWPYNKHSSNRLIFLAFWPDKTTILIVRFLSSYSWIFFDMFPNRKPVLIYSWVCCDMETLILTGRFSKVCGHIERLVLLLHFLW